jgi:TRAP-type C4-dicarboxylate transport system permease small subunit
MGQVKTFLCWLNRINKAAAVCAIALFLALTAIVCLNVITRPIGYPIAWTDEMTRFFLVWGVMLGMALTLHEGRHIRVVILVQKLSLKHQKLIDIWMDLIAVIILGIFVMQGYKFAMYTKGLGETSQGALDFPIWWAMIALPIGGGLFFLRYLIKAIENIMGFINGDNRKVLFAEKNKND